MERKKPCGDMDELVRDRDWNLTGIEPRVNGMERTPLNMTKRRRHGSSEIENYTFGAQVRVLKQRILD